MTAVSAVRIHDNLAARQSRIAHRSADDEVAGGIDVILRARINHRGRKYRVNHFFPDSLRKLVVRNLVAVLRGNDYAIHARRTPVNVFDRDLGFSIGPEEIQNVFLSDFSKAAGQLMRELDWHGHQFRRLIARETEHQALIARSAGINSHGDIGRLLLDRAHDAAGFGIEAVFRAVVAHLPDHLARHIVEVHVALGRDFAGNHHQAGRNQRLAGDAALRVLLHHFVEDGVGNLVGDLVRVAFRYGLRRKQEAFFGCGQNNLLWCERLALNLASNSLFTWGNAKNRT